MAFPEKQRGKLTGKWCVDLRQNGAHAYRGTFDTMEEAEQAEAYFRKFGRAPSWPKGTNGLTFGAVAQECWVAGGPRGKWLHGRDMNARTRLDRAVAFLGTYPIEAVRTPELRKYQAHLLKRKLSNATVNRCMDYASSVLTFAHQQDYIQGVPKKPRLEEDGARDAWLTQEQQDTVTRAMRARGWSLEALLVEVLAETGLRLGELYSLTTEQIGNDTLTLKGGTVTKKHARCVVLPPRMADDLRNLVSSDGLPGRLALIRKFQTACEMTGQDSTLVLHSLRHTRATRLMLAGVSPSIICKMLGWSSPRMLMRYTHPDMDAQRAAAKKVAQTDWADGGKATPVPVNQVA